MDNRQYEFDTGEIGLLDIVKVIKRRLKLAIVLFLCVYILSHSVLYLIFKLKDQFRTMYKAEASIMIVGETFEVKTSAGDIVQKKELKNAVSILESEIIASRAIEVLRDTKGYVEPAADMLEDIEKNLYLKLVKKPRIQASECEIADISYVNTSPERAFNTILAILDAYKYYQKQEEEAFYKNTYSSFKHQLDVLYSDLNVSKNKLTNFIHENQDIVSIRHMSSLAGIKSEDVSYENVMNYYLREKSDIADKGKFLDTTKRLAKEDRLLAATNINVMRKDIDINMDLRKQLLDKEEELNMLLLVNEEAHPDVISRRRELQSLYNKIDAETGNAINQIELDLSTQTQIIQELYKILSKSDTQNILSNYEILRKDVEVKQEAYNKIAKDIQDLSIGSQRERYSGIKILKQPVIPDEPSSTPAKTTVKIIAIAFFLSILAALCVVYMLESMDDSVKTADDLEKRVDAPMLATIPMYGKIKKH